MHIHAVYFLDHLVCSFKSMMFEKFCYIVVTCNYIRQGGYVFTRVSVSVCLCVTSLTHVMRAKLIENEAHFTYFLKVVY